MEESILYNLIEKVLVYEWKEEIEKRDECQFLHRERAVLEELTALQGEKGRKLLSAYSNAVENRADFVSFYLSIKILNLGIKIGMELNNAFIQGKEEG